MQKISYQNNWNNINKKIIKVINEIELAKSEVIHFVGIGGIGMSGLALIMQSMGLKFKDLIFHNKNIER